MADINMVFLEEKFLGKSAVTVTSLRKRKEKTESSEANNLLHIIIKSIDMIMPCFIYAAANFLIQVSKLVCQSISST